MTPQPTTEQPEYFENALKIGAVLASTAGTGESFRVRVNPHTLDEVVALYTSLGAKMPPLQETERFVMNCLLHSAETYAVCSHRIILCHYLIGCDIVYWYGNGKIKDREPLENVITFSDDNCMAIASILLERPIFLRLEQFLTPQTSTVS